MEPKNKTFVNRVVIYNSKSAEEGSVRSVIVRVTNGQELCHKIYQHSDCRNCHQMEWNIKNNLSEREKKV